MADSPSDVPVDAGVDPYGIKLEVFEGPLDLLLFLIRKDEIDIHDIPIAEITRQFLGYVEVIQELNLEQAGDFVLMAATLMKIKSRMLLPPEPGEEEAAEDPRQELVRRLLEYQQFKEMAAWMEEQQDACRDRFYRGAALERGGLDGTDGAEASRPVGFFDLLAAFKRALDSAASAGPYQVAGVEVSIEDCAQRVLELLEARAQVSFTDLVSGLPRLVLIATFIALLELVRTAQIVARQVQAEGEIWIYRREEGEAAGAGGALAAGAREDG